MGRLRQSSKKWPPQSAVGSGGDFFSRFAEGNEKKIARKKDRPVCCSSHRNNNGQRGRVLDGAIAATAAAVGLHE